MLLAQGRFWDVRLAREVVSIELLREAQSDALPELQIDAALSPFPLRAPVKTAVREALKPLLGKPYNEVEVRDMLATAFNAPELRLTMNSEPHIFDLEYLRDSLYFSKTVANAQVKEAINTLLANWRENTPTSRKAEILINNEEPESEHHTSCPSYGREDEADVICNCGATP